MVVLGLISCDGRSSFNKVETIQQNKLSNTQSEKTQYVPEEYTEVVNDTIFSNGYQVKIKMYSDSTRSVIVKSKKDKINHSTIYRDFNADIIINKNENEILNITLNKEHLVIKELLTRLRMDTYYLKTIWIEESKESKESINEGAPYIYLKYFAPSHKSYTTLEVFPLGNNRFSITEI